MPTMLLLLLSRLSSLRARQKSPKCLTSLILRSQSNTTTTSINVQNVDFHVTIQNYTPSKKQTVVLCLPGALGIPTLDFQPQFQQPLHNDICLVGIDPRGLGQTKMEPPLEYPIHYYYRDAMDYHSIMEQLFKSTFTISKQIKYSIMGWSDGAIIAMLMAARYNTFIDKLVIWGGNAYVDPITDVAAWEAVRNVSQSWSKRMIQEKLPLFDNDMNKLQHVNSIITDAWINNAKANFGDVCLREIHQITCPTLILHGQQDVICSQDHAQYIHNHIANSQLQIFSQGKHNLHIKYATEFNDMVTKFILTQNQNDQNNLDSTKPAIEDIAYGFMGSKALFVALQCGIFDAIAHANNTNHTQNDNDNENNNNLVSLQDIQQQLIKQNNPISIERLQTLLTACVSLNLIRCRRQDGNNQYIYWLPKTTHDQLVSTSKRYWGDYLVGQVNAQFYNRMSDLATVMTTGTNASHGYESWFEQDPSAARKYTLAQHNGSLATGYALCKRLNPFLQQQQDQQQQELTILDVGGGSGAFSIAMARKLPLVKKAIVLDLPNVIPVAQEIIAQEPPDIQEKLDTLALSATNPGQWQGVVPDQSFDIVLLSYVSGSIPSTALESLYLNAFKALRPGGFIVIHDFMVQNSGQGPKNASLWALAHVTVNPEGMGLQIHRVVSLLDSVGYVAPKVQELIPGATQMIVAMKPKN